MVGAATAKPREPKHVRTRVLYLWFILLSQILCTPSKLTKEYWTLIYINNSFSLMQLLTLFKWTHVAQHTLAYYYCCSWSGLRLFNSTGRSSLYYNDSRIWVTKAGQCIVYVLSVYETKCRQHTETILSPTASLPSTAAGPPSVSREMYTACDRHNRLID